MSAERGPYPHFPRWRDRHLNPWRCWLFGHRWRQVEPDVEGCRRCRATQGEGHAVLDHLARELDSGSSEVSS